MVNNYGFLEHMGEMDFDDLQEKILMTYRKSCYA